MNVIGAGALSDVDVAGITADIVGLFEDSDMSTTVVFFTPSSSSMDAASGTVSHAGDQDTVVGWLTPLTLDEIGDNNELQVGDQRLLAEASQFTSAPNTDSRFRASTTIYAVVSVETAKFASAVFYEVVGRPISQ